MKRLIILTSIWLVAGISFAANDPTGMHHRLYPRPPIYGIPAKTLPRGRFIYRSYFTFDNFTKMLDKQSGDMVSMPDGTSFQSYSFTPKLRYGATNKFTLIANFPFYYKQFDKNGVLKQGLGPGDIVLAGLYRLYFNKTKHFLISGLIYSKFPTGKVTGTEEKELPLGTGSMDAGFALLPEKEFGNLDLRGAAFYVFRGKTPYNVNLGDIRLCYLTGAWNFSRNFIAEATVLHKTSGLSISSEKKEINNTDMRLTQILVGAQFRLKPALLLQAAVPVTLSAYHVPFSSPYGIWIGIFCLL